MKKGKIITISIISFFVLLNVILFGFVFRLRKQTVRFVGDVSVSEQAIIDVAGLKTGGSIFMLDKQTATQKIEKDFPYLKVIEISTKSVTKIEFVIRSRYEMFYIESNGWNYILDEDLKVLDKRESLTEAQLDLICLDLPLAEQDNINKEHNCRHKICHKVRLTAAVYISVVKVIVQARYAAEYEERNVQR